MPPNGADPLTHPLVYPGELPTEPAVVLLAAEVLAAPTRNALDALLHEAGAPPLSARTPVAAVGSNASPAQLARKFTAAGLTPAVPITSVRITGLAAGLSAHVSAPGYVPATPVPAPGRASPLHLTWLTRAELAVLDATEPNYRRVRLPASHPAALPAGHRVPGAWIYASRHGHLIDPAGDPLPLTSQREVLTHLIARLPALGPTTPESWIEAARDPAWRTRVSALLHTEGLSQPPLSL